MKKTAGFSLFEILLACALGSMIMLGVLSCYAQLKKHFTQEIALLDMQDSARLASHFLSEDIRQSGFMGCLTGRSDANIFNHTPVIFHAVMGCEKTSEEGGAIELMYVTHAVNVIKTSIDGQTLRLGKPFSVSPGDRVLVSDCHQGDIITVKRLSKDGLRLTSMQALSVVYGKQTQVAKLIDHRYFVDKTRRSMQGKTIKALYIKGLDGKKQELLENIDKMVLYYFVGGRFIKASSIHDWSKVRGVDIHLLSEAPDMLAPFYREYFFDGKVEISERGVFHREMDTLVARRAIDS